jgi:hypothetical protein
MLYHCRIDTVKSLRDDEIDCSWLNPSLLIEVVLGLCTAFSSAISTLYGYIGLQKDVLVNENVRNATLLDELITSVSLASSLGLDGV